MKNAEEIRKLIRNAWWSGMSSAHDCKSTKSLEIELDDYMDSMEDEILEQSKEQIKQCEHDFAPLMDDIMICSKCDECVEIEEHAKECTLENCSGCMYLNVGTNQMPCTSCEDFNCYKPLDELE